MPCLSFVQKLKPILKRGFLRQKCITVQEISEPLPLKISIRPIGKIDLAKIGK